MTAALSLAGCGGGGSSDSGQPVAGSDNCTAGSGSTVTYATSQPLTDNSSAGAYKVLLMGNSHAAGLRPTLEQLLDLLRAVEATAATEIDCDELLSRVAAYMESRDGEALSEDDRRSVAQHLTICPECREEFDALLRATGEE